MTPYEKRMAKLMLKPYDILSKSEKIELIDYRYNFRREKISYEEFAMLCLANQELEFVYQGKTYEITNGLKSGRSFFWGTVYAGTGNHRKCTWEQEKNYDTTEELLDGVRINGKTIKDIWDDISFI